ncbi:uncharacterized protein LOC142880662 isoform X2 [Nelusetta ayraudi]|uniref:uncharacterized protein LOC142880662 isoform X2 n=1 Tax=Nelusetta ayraudi TaxID=303726 RepID=UPI003F72CF68
MMEYKKALKIPFKVDKDHVVPWTNIPSCKRKHCDSQNGCNLFDQKLAAEISLEFKRRKACVTLTDILQTDQGKAHLGRIKQRCNLGKQVQVSDLPKGCGKNKDEPSVCRDKAPSLKSANKDTNKNTTPQRNKKTPTLSSPRSLHRRNSEHFAEEAVKERTDRIRATRDCEEDYTFSEVVDCGLSVRWEPTEGTEACCEFSPANIKETWTDPEREVLQELDKRKKNAASLCSRGGDGGDGRQVLAHTFLEKHMENGSNAESMSTEVSVEECGEDADSSQDASTTSSAPDPIVLSSDEGEPCDTSQCPSSPDKTQVSVETAETEEEPLSTQEEEPEEAPDTCRDMQLYEVFLDNLPAESISVIPNTDYPTVAFSSLYSGAYHIKSAGHIMIGKQKILIQLKDVKEQQEGVVTFEGNEMQWYSVWNQEEMVFKGVPIRFDVEPPAPVALLLCVSEAAAAVVQRELFKLCAKHRHIAETERFSPFILLTLSDSLHGIEGNVFLSLLELHCHKNSELLKSAVSLDADKIPGLAEGNMCVLSVETSVQLIRGTGLDSHLLSLLGLGGTKPSEKLDHNHVLTRTVQKQTVIIQAASDSQNGTVLESEPVGVPAVEVRAETDQTERVSEAPPEKEEATSVYALCHRRSGESYTATPCKPDSSWTKYKHQGLPRRLIQFPPPPLKGGITVTAEDLQCLDSGQYLNDVIIDFYLKYLLHKAPAAIAERTHIFSSFFYKQLTRRDNASEGNTKDSCQRQRRHQRVKTWTRHVDIFKKDFLFVPVNHDAHWYLAIVCFPGLTEPTSENTGNGNDASSVAHMSNGATEECQELESFQGSGRTDDKTETTPSVINRVGGNPETEKSQEESTQDRKPGPVSCTEKTCNRRTVFKRPCILIMDSLKLSHHERVFKLLRDYLECEWEFRRGSSKEFGADQMQSSHCRVPLQDNSSDCGLYLLQYVESFLEDPVVLFDLPLHLERWFPRQLVRRKRNEIRDLVLSLHRQQSSDGGT